MWVVGWYDREQVLVELVLASFLGVGVVIIK
jgi:hypothetical protein